jgi:ABC-type multidrug transport system fused ATPase/permease subunit
MFHFTPPSRLSRISHPMSLNDTSNAIKDAYADEIDEYDEENLPATSTTRIIKLNASEWPQLLFGSLAAFINGSVLPICAWIISYILGYLGEPDQTTKRDGILRACIVFILIAVIQLGTQFLQGYLFGISGERLTRKMRKQGFHAILRQGLFKVKYANYENQLGLVKTSQVDFQFINLHVYIEKSCLKF